MKRFISVAAGLLLCAGCSTVPVQKPYVPAVKGGDVRIFTSLVQNKDAFAAGRLAGLKLQQQVGGLEPSLVVLAECYADKKDKEAVLRGAEEVFGKGRVVSFAVYGLYTQEGALDRNGAAIFAVAGNGTAARTVCSPKINQAAYKPLEEPDAFYACFTNAAAVAAGNLPVREDTRAVLVLADCHSPRNQFLVDGLQSVYGKNLPMAGGSVNKNVGFSWLGYNGSLVSDSAVLIALDGAFRVFQFGEQARENAAVLKTAENTASVLRGQVKGELAGGLFFDCAGRKGKLESIEEEQASVRKGLGDGVPFFGVWCAGEIGCADDSAGVPVGRGWHIMGTVFERVK